MASAQHIAADLLAPPRQVTNGLDPLIRHMHPSQLPGQQQPRQQLGVLAIGFYAIGRSPGRLARRDDLNLDTRGLRGSVEPKPSRPGLIGTANGTRQLTKPRDHRFNARTEPHTLKFPRSAN